jgi:hypothetical protein
MTGLFQPNALLLLVNNVRQTHGLAPLTLDVYTTYSIISPV